MGSQRVRHDWVTFTSLHPKFALLHFFSVSSSFRPPYLFLFWVVTYSLHHPQAWKGWSMKKAGLSVVSFPVSTLEIGRFLGLFYFFYSHPQVLTIGIIYSVRVSGFEINPRWLRAMLHRLCPSLTTHYDCRATNILMVPGTHAKRKTVYLVKTAWCSGDFPGGPVAKTVQQDKLYCAHASSEKSFIPYYKPKHPHGAAGYCSESHWQLWSFCCISNVMVIRIMGILGVWVFWFFILSPDGAESPFQDLWAGWALDITPGSCWTTLESMVVGGAFQGYHLSTLLILYRTESNPERECLVWKQVSSQWRDWNFF